MTAQELKEVRAQFGFNQVEMAKWLNTPHKIYQRWEKGASRIPGVVEVAIWGPNEYKADVLLMVGGRRVNIKSKPEFSREHVDKINKLFEERGGWLGDQ